MTEVFALTMSPWEILVRGTAVYFALVILIRIIPKRDAGRLSPNDLLILVLIGGMGSDALMGGSHSVGDVLSMVALILGWAYILGVLEYRFPRLHRLFRDSTTPLVEDGRLLRRNMRREMVTEEELRAVLRKEGIADIAEVHSACMEADGEISVIRRKRA